MVVNVVLWLVIVFPARSLMPLVPPVIATVIVELSGNGACGVSMTTDCVPLLVVPKVAVYGSDVLPFRMLTVDGLTVKVSTSSLNTSRIGALSPMPEVAFGGVTDETVGGVLSVVAVG